MQTLTKIIEDWIGDPVTFSSKENERYNAGYALALADLRSRVPELVELIRMRLADPDTLDKFDIDPYVYALVVNSIIQN